MQFTHRLAALAAATALAGFVMPARASVILNDNFASFTPGDLAGQQGYTQQGTVATNPIQVSAGAVQIPGQAPAATVDDQDVYKALPYAVVAPASGTVSVYVTLQLSVASAGANPSYFFGMAPNTDGTPFTNARISAKDNGGGTYVFGARVTGQGGFPYVYGATGLTYGSSHKLVMELDQVAGAQNDVIKLFVDPPNTNYASQTPYVTETFTSGTGTDPGSVGAIVFSQFANATTQQDAVSISSVSVDAPVPEPTALGLVGMLGAGCLARRRRATRR